MRARIHQQGIIIYQVLVIGGAALLFLAGLISWASGNIKAGQQLYIRERALAIAEAGIEYYRWHLAHNPTDYQDGTAGAGPYIHNYYGADGVKVGRFELTITAPLLGSTVTTIISTGYADTNPNTPRTIRAIMAKPSLARYAVAANADIRFGNGTEIFGPVHSNGGIRFDGLAHNIVSSAQSTYDDPDHTGGLEFGVHTHLTPVDPLPPAAVPARADVFQVGRQFPVPAIDFAGFTADLAGVKTTAQNGGIYKANSGAAGYHLVLKTNNTVDIYRVTATVAPPSNCTNSQGQSGWGTWSIQSETFIENRAIPANGAIFIEDNVWVNGQIDGARVTIASARFPEDPATDTSITINENLLYTHYDGTDVISLMAQNNINAGLVSADTYRIDAAMIAKNGRVGRYYYRGSGGGSQRCAPYHQRASITLWGMLATNRRYGFAYTDGTGYQIRNINYDGNLLYNPPPYFPVTAEQYQTISWQEIK